MKSYADQIRAWVPTPYKVLGTDGFGRSDTRAKLRELFEVDARYVVIAALDALREEGKLDATVVKQAIDKYGIDADKTFSLYA
mgnify:CR=1 FL=1